MSLTTRYIVPEVPPMREFNARGQICAFAVSWNDVPPAVKTSGLRLLN